MKERITVFLLLLVGLSGCQPETPPAPTPPPSAQLTIEGERCSIYVNEELKGSPPVTVTVQPGRSYEIRAQDYDGSSQRKSVVAKAGPETITFAFRKRTGVTITAQEIRGTTMPTTMPHNLVVKIDGKIQRNGLRKGLRIDYPVTPGQHVVEISAPGVKRVRQEFLDQVGIQLNIPRGKVRITAPKGSEVFVGGASQGYAPVTVGDLPIGLEEVEVRVPNCKPRRIYPTVNAGQTTAVNAPPGPDSWKTLGKGLTYERKSLARPQNGVVVAWVRGPLVVKGKEGKPDETLSECLVRIDKVDHSYQRVDTEGFEIQRIPGGSAWDQLAKAL